jgi:hypothetical protein
MRYVPAMPPKSRRRPSCDSAETIKRVVLDGQMQQIGSSAAEDSIALENPDHRI